MDIEQRVFDANLVQGEALIKDIKEGKGFKYSVVLSGEIGEKKKRETIGYIVAIDEKIDKDNLSICLEDFAIIPEVQRKGLGWKIMEQFIEKLKDEVKKESKQVFLYMYLRENSKAFMDKHQKYLEKIGVRLVKEAVMNDYYNIGQDAVYQLYKLKN